MYSRGILFSCKFVAVSKESRLFRKSRCIDTSIFGSRLKKYRNIVRTCKWHKSYIMMKQKELKIELVKSKETRFKEKLQQIK